MYLTVKQQLKHLSRPGYQALRELSHAAKNLYNEAVYNIRQYYFTEGEFLSYEKNYVLLKESPNYRLLNSNMAQQILKEVNSAFKSFFGLLRLAKKGKYRYSDIKLPSYLPKDGFATLVIGFIRIKDGQLAIPFSQGYKKTHEPIMIKLPPVLKGRKVKEIRIIPRSDARFFEIQYTCERECIQRNLNRQKALACDLGVDNLVTAVSNTGESFILDGRRLKAVNQWFNKENARLQSIKDKQGFGKERTKRQERLGLKRKARVNDYLSKAAKYIIDFCISHDIGILVAGYNETFQKGASLGKRNNQNFVCIPFGQLREKLEYLCMLNGIMFVRQEESYTSKASFFDMDNLPEYNPDNPCHYEFSGKRIKRGLYRTKDGCLVNADVNGACNILKKSNVVGLKALYDRGGVDTPMRIRIA